jgi:NodT family efflux transporter outer membrane factor (OMF) lipoprotein
MKYFRISLFSIALALLAGCSVGPKYARPSVPVTPAYKEPPPDSFKESNGWKAAQPEDQSLRGNWWEIFGDPQLNELESQIAVSNQNLKIAEAQYRQARAMVRYNRASEFPSITTAPSVSSNRYSGNRSLPSPRGAFSDFVLPVDLSYEVDLWGRIRHMVTEAREQAQATAADLANVNLSLHAELAMDYFQLRSFDSEQEVLDATVKAYEAALRLTTNRYEGGAAAKSEVAQAQTQLDTTRAQSTDIQVQRSQYEHAIATLIGKPPASFSLPASPLKMKPPSVPPGVPSELLERRPDIAASERRVAAANEQIGVARAAFFPALVLSATGGFEGSSIASWLNWPSRFWAVGPSAVQTLFDAGRRRAASEQTLAGYDATVADYRQTTLNAFQQVEDNLAALRILETEAQQQRSAVESSQNLLDLSLNRYKGGVDTYLQVITAQTQNLSNQRTAIDIERRRADASVLLIKALGGGWDTSKLPAIASLR